MRRTPSWIILLVLIFLVAVLFAALCTTTTAAEEKHKLHLIVFAQDPETEIEVRIGEGERRTELVDAGVTYMTYKTTNPTVQAWTFGSKETPRVDKGRDGDYYCMIFVQPPEDGEA